MTKQVIKPHLVYRLVPMEKAVVFQILEMDEGQRIKHARFEASNGIKVLSVACPEINSRIGNVYLRGTDGASDEAIGCSYFNSNEERDEFIEKVHQALREWCDAGGFEGARQYVGDANPLLVVDWCTYRIGGRNG